MITADHCTNPQSIRASIRHMINEERWRDPEYQAIEATFLRENPVCEYCGRLSQVAHHDKPEHYRSKEAYYDKRNMTPACYECHSKYRRNLEICPSCLAAGHYGYMRGGSLECSRHRGDARGPWVRRQQRYTWHTCDKNLGQQRCSDGRVCPHSPRKAEDDCEWFLKRVKL
jgi:hypothetical protein